jgi:hypothetical protein
MLCKPVHHLSLLFCLCCSCMQVHTSRRMLQVQLQNISQPAHPPTGLSVSQFNRQALQSASPPASQPTNRAVSPPVPLSASRPARQAATSGAAHSLAAGALVHIPGLEHAQPHTCSWITTRARGPRVMRDSCCEALKASSCVRVEVCATAAGVPAAQLLAP